MKLKGKTVLFLGSSVTYGAFADGVSFADLMPERCGIRCIKEAYDFYIPDLYNDEEMRNVDEEAYHLYMHDPVHPTLQG